MYRHPTFCATAILFLTCSVIPHIRSVGAAPPLKSVTLSLAKESNDTSSEATGGDVVIGDVPSTVKAEVNHVTLGLQNKGEPKQLVQPTGAFGKSNPKARRPILESASTSTPLPETVTQIVNNARQDEQANNLSISSSPLPPQATSDHESTIVVDEAKTSPILIHSTPSSISRQEESATPKVLEPSEPKESSSEQDSPPSVPLDSETVKDVLDTKAATNVETHNDHSDVHHTKPSPDKQETVLRSAREFTSSTTRKNVLSHSLLLIFAIERITLHF